MTRLLTPRGLGLTALALVAVGVMVVLGLWQLGVYDDHQHDDAVAALEREPVPLDDLVGPDDGLTSSDVGRPVEVSGRYDVAGQFYVRGFEGAGDDLAVVTPLVTSSGAAVLVVRGAGDVADAQPPSDTVTVTGVLEASDAGASPLDDSRMTDGISIAALVSSVDTDLYAGYAIAADSDPADTLRAIAPPEPDASQWAGIRNLLYAVQWWLFACFAVFMWWRILNEQRDSELMETTIPG